MAGRKLWEARPLLNGSGQPTIYNKLAIEGNVAILQSGADTNDRVRIAEVRRYTPQETLHPLEDMVAELGTDLLPDVADIRSRAVVYEELYGSQWCAGASWQCASRGLDPVACLPVALLAGALEW